jgi:hypothetical protein
VVSEGMASGGDAEGKRRRCCIKWIAAVLSKHTGH